MSELKQGGRKNDPADMIEKAARTIQTLNGGEAGVDVGEGPVLDVIEGARSPRPRKQWVAQPAQAGTHIVPMPETESEAYDAAKYLAEEEERRRLRNEARATKEAATYRYYLKCRAGHHGIYFARNMGEAVIGDRDWFATYKRQDEIWRQDIICQVCLKAGQENRLDYLTQNWREGKWMPANRWMWKSPIDPKRWAIEGDTRAMDLPGEANNAWREDVRSRLIAAGINPDE